MPNRVPRSQLHTLVRQANAVLAQTKPEALSTKYRLALDLDEALNRIYLLEKLGDTMVAEISKLKAGVTASVETKPGLDLKKLRKEARNPESNMDKVEEALSEQGGENQVFHQRQLDS